MSGPPKYAQRPDGKHSEMVLAFRGLGASVVDLHLVGGGCPDLCVGVDGMTLLVEIKKPKGPKGGASEDGQKLSEKQIEFHATWRGAPVHVVRTLEDVGVLVNAAKARP